MDLELRKKLKELFISGATTGGVLGAGSSFLSGAKSKSSIAKTALLSALASGGLSAGSGYVGNKILGVDDGSDETANTKRGALGGAVAGGVLGASLGGLTKFKSVRNRLLRNASTDSLRSNILKKMAQHPGKAALGLALGLGAIGAYQGADEGMQADFVENLKKQKMKQKMLAQIND